MEKPIEEMSYEEMKESFHRMMSTPPGTCWKCGAHFFTISPRTMCTRCLGGFFGVEPFSFLGLLIGLIICLAMILCITRVIK